jgi:hypothetical protein
VLARLYGCPGAAVEPQPCTADHRAPRLMCCAQPCALQFHGTGRLRGPVPPSSDAGVSSGAVVFVEAPIFIFRINLSRCRMLLLRSCCCSRQPGPRYVRWMYLRLVRGSLLYVLPEGWASCRWFMSCRSIAEHTSLHYVLVVLRCRPCGDGGLRHQCCHDFTSLCCGVASKNIAARELDALDG